MTAPAHLSSELVRPFTVHVPQAAVDDLHDRLDRTRWPDPETVDDWSQGARQEDLRAFVEHWRHRYDPHRLADRLNRHPRFVTTLDGLDVHFLHVRSPHPGALPLVLTHGWPGSVLDFVDLVGPLTDPVAHGGDAADAFDVVVPSLPGCGFSGKPTATGWDVVRTARAWTELVRRLGYREWAAHGGDWGAVVTSALGEQWPEGLLGVHLTNQYVLPRNLSQTLPTVLSEEERRGVESFARYTGDLGGSNHLQATRPQTVGYALTDSPVGQAAWLYEKFQAKTDNRGLAEDAVDVDVLLDAVSLHWFTGTATSSARTYWENRSASLSGPRLRLPVAATVFPRDCPRPARSWIEDAYPDLRHLGEPAAGGHFPGLEQPDVLVREIRDGLRSVRPPATPQEPGATR